MSTPNSGGPAFPQPFIKGDYGVYTQACDVGCGGMSLREWLTGQVASRMFEYSAGCDIPMRVKLASELSVAYADALLDELEKAQ